MMMAKASMGDGEFWLPSDFLDNDDFLATESEEEDYLAGLMSKSMIEDSPQVLATSPQSTLGSWSFSSSPESPSTPFAKPRGSSSSSSDNALEVLYQAAGQVVRLGLNAGRERALLGQPVTKSSHVLHDKEALIQQQLRAAHFYQLKKQQLLKQQHAAVAAAAAWGRQSRARQYGASAWPPLQKQQQQQQHHHHHHHHQQNLNGSGMRAVFLNGAAARKESSGTGVFLPRRVGAPSEPKKKPACSTVLLPDRVVQALNLNLPPSGFVLDHDVMSNVAKRNHHYAQQAAPAAAAASHEIRLPPEWTY